MLQLISFLTCTNAGRAQWQWDAFPNPDLPHDPNWQDYNEIDNAAIEEAFQQSKSRVSLSREGFHVRFDPLLQSSDDGFKVRPIRRTEVETSQGSASSAAPAKVFTLRSLDAEVVDEISTGTFSELQRKIENMGYHPMITEEEFEELMHKNTPQDVTVVKVIFTKKNFIAKVHEMIPDMDDDSGKWAYYHDMDHDAKPPHAISKSLPSMFGITIEDEKLVMSSGGWVGSGMKGEDVPGLLSEIFDWAAENEILKELFDCTKLCAGARHGRLKDALREFADTHMLL